MSKKLKHCNNNENNMKVVIIPLVIIITIISIIILIFFLKGSKSDEKIIPDGRNVVQTSTATIKTETEIKIQEETIPSVETIPEDTTEYQEKENSEKFNLLISGGGYDEEEINYNQLIIVESDGTSATVNCFEKIEGVWEDVPDLSDISGFVGAQGVSYDANEYENYTPKGLFGIGTGFGICENPGTGLDYFQVTQNSYWVDDADSAYYNQHIEGVENKDWSSAEHLIDYPGSYDYGVFIEYNSNPVVPGKGSAFFLHVGTTPTAGCVAVPEEYMIKTLKWLQKDKKPAIMIY